MEQHEQQVKPPITIQVQSFVPLMTQEQFGSLIGLSYDTIKAQCINGHLPTVKIGKYRMINLVALTDTAKQSAISS